MTRKVPDWRWLLVMAHRWLGIAGGWLFILWFASGLVLAYRGMPDFAERDRLDRLPPLDLSRASHELAETASLYGTPERVRIAMLGDRPVYRFLVRGQWITVFADTAGQLPDLDPDEAVRLAAAFAPPGERITPRYDARLTEPDQWTFSERAAMPLHRVVLNDRAGTVFYISDRTGEPAMATTSSGRRWGYAGAVTHWLYAPPLRRRAALWTEVVIWSSVAGCVLTLTGLIWGLLRMPRRSPYRGLLRWHHYAGLIFGLTTLTWVFSGLLSMEPWNLSPSRATTRTQRVAFTGGPLQLESVSLARLRDALGAAGPGVKEIEVVQFRGQPFLIDNTRRVLGPHPDDRSEDGLLSDDALAAAAREAMPDATVVDITHLDRYDAYYYARAGALPLPVVRVRYDDAEGTWLYVDPVRGAIARKEVRGSRVYRWLYHGFHSLDFPWLYDRRPLWDAVLIVLSAGGLFLSATTFLPGWRRAFRRRA